MNKMGRKGFYDEKMVKKIVDSSNRIILLTLQRKGWYKDVDKAVLIELASRFALKAIPQVVENDGIGNTNIVRVYLPKAEDTDNRVASSQRTADLIPSQ